MNTPNDKGRATEAQFEQARYARIEQAAQALLADVHRRYPGEALQCPFMAELEAACETPARTTSATPTSHSEGNGCGHDLTRGAQKQNSGANETQELQRLRAQNTRLMNQVDRWARLSERNGWLDPEDFDEWRNSSEVHIKRLRGALEYIADPSHALDHPDTARVFQVHALSALQLTYEAPDYRKDVFHEGRRQTYLKAVELSIASGLLGEGDRSDLLAMYEHLWSTYPEDIRIVRLRS